MGSMTLVFAVLTVVVTISYIEAGNCPLPSKVYSCSPKCTQDYECTNGKVCCPNSCNAKSCSVQASGGTGSGGSSQSAYGGPPSVQCDNVRCNPHEVCKMDPLTKRKKCSRA